jgi:hypothetical protein
VRYRMVVESAFGWARVDDAMLVKMYRPRPEREAARRYSPSPFISAEKVAVMGKPDMKQVSTSLQAEQPHDADADEALRAAHFENGVRNVTIPKSERARRRKVEVQSGGDQKRVEATRLCPRCDAWPEFTSVEPRRDLTPFSARADTFQGGPRSTLAGTDLSTVQFPLVFTTSPDARNRVRGGRRGWHPTGVSSPVAGTIAETPYGHSDQQIDE